LARRSRGDKRKSHKLTEAGVTLLLIGLVAVGLPLIMPDAAIVPIIAPFAAVAWGAGGVGVLFIVLGALPALRAKPAPKPMPLAAPTVYVRTGPSTQERSLTRSTMPRPAAPERPPADAVPVRPTAWGREVFDQIEWRRFEAVVERMFQQAGFQTRALSHGADEGVDVWLFANHQRDVPAGLVQCKHWQGKRVGVDKVRELRGVMAARNIKRGQLATTSTFTPDAVAFARDNGINLLDVDGLLAIIARRSDAQRAELLAVALEGDYWRPTCVKCGAKMKARLSKDGGAPFWGCSNFPRCSKTMAMRSANAG